MKATPDRPAAERSHEFDFLLGSWKVCHRRLTDRLSGCTEWIEHGGAMSAREVMGGQGIVDDNLIASPGGTYHALTVRLFDPASGQWSIWWFDGRSPNRTDPPLVGTFEGDAGTFFAEDVLKRRPIRVRFRWSRAEDGAPRWEQAFSPDGGRSWETNWIMVFERV
jgi:hypothetical protein